MADAITYLVDEPDALVPLATTFTWEDYANALVTLEGVVSRLFVEGQAADAAAESALSGADGALDPIAQQIKDMQSDIAALQTHADLLSAQVLPVTGGQYTHLVAETFRSSSVRDTVSSYDTQPLTLQSGIQSGCPARTALEVDATTQNLRQSRVRN